MPGGIDLLLMADQGGESDHIDVPKVNDGGTDP